jgi:hypothetical protein
MEICNIKFIPLKDEIFYYCEKKYTERRFVSKDKKIVVLINELDYVRIAIANEEGKGHFIDEIYADQNRHSYPIYAITDAIQKLLKLNLHIKNEFIIHPSQYK